MKINTSDYYTTAAKQEGYPDLGYPEVVLLGRSNVGKSTFINKMLGRKNLARISTTPGKTRALNFYIVNDEMFFVDVPGYGYAKVSQKERAVFGEMIEEYLLNRNELRYATLLIDFKVGPTVDDILMYEFLKFHDIPTVIVATKKDKVKSSARNKQKNAIKAKIEFDPRHEFFVYSATDNNDIINLRNRMGEWIGFEEEVSAEQE